MRSRPIEPAEKSAIYRSALPPVPLARIHHPSVMRLAATSGFRRCLYGGTSEHCSPIKPLYRFF